MLEEEGAIQNRITYTEQMYDGVTGQYYLRARFYNPTLGRFLQEDPYREDGLNLYSYCSNNPVMYYDPSGLAGLCPGGKTNAGNSQDKPNQIHHFATDKSKKYTSQMEYIASKYGLDLDDDWNKALMPHQGRHPNAYHDYILDNMQKFDQLAGGNQTQFLEVFDQMKQGIISKPEMLYKKYWNSIRGK